MATLGLVGDEVSKRHFVCEDELTAVAHYGGRFVSEHMRIATCMAGGRPSQAPPDLSLPYCSMGGYATLACRLWPKLQSW